MASSDQKDTAIPGVDQAEDQKVQRTDRHNCLRESTCCKLCWKYKGKTAVVVIILSFICLIVLVVIVVTTVELTKN